MAGRKPCPICAKPPSPSPAHAHAPFCSQGCRDRDLLRWLGEGYAIPAATPPGDEQWDEDGLDSMRTPD